MQASGSFVTIDNTEYYKISNSEKLKPFFIQVASASDIWIFLSSNGGLTAGRGNANGNLFPYETDDKLNFDYETGSKTVIKIGEKAWQPFDQNGIQKYNISRNIYKSCYATSVIMEEINHDLHVSYSYKYESSEKFGFVKTAKITNLSDENLKFEVLDGLMNIMPYGVNSTLQATSSTLVDAYKASELLGGKLGIYSMTTTINDTPHPIEMLKANIAYTTLNDAKIFLDPDIISNFIYSKNLDIEPECYGKKSGFFSVFSKEITAKNNFEYSYVLDNGYDHAKIVEINEFIQKNDFSDLFVDIKKGTSDIVKIVSEADGIQSSGDKVACATHYLSTLYNVMRGGTFEDGYEFDYNIFIKFIQNRNKKIMENTKLLDEIKTCKTINELKKVAKKCPVMHRLALEFMPLSFSRRHGDPSRPWNKFNIALKDENGDKTVNYEGNWRDIFQNWEALGLSYPSYYENMVAKFVNASTFDGFNPYKINDKGIDWERPEPENPFSGLGYWGDHQIIYLLRLLQGLSNHFPSKLEKMLSDEIFCYANVPYEIKDYSEILKDSKKTITFDEKRDLEIEKLVKKHGTDGKLLLKNDEVYSVSLTEKLLVPVLSKISNLLPGGGIWMNTQRPEWNDANNAIVGIGLSMITVYHVKAYLEFLKKIFEEKTSDFSVSVEVSNWLISIKNLLNSYNNQYIGNEKAILDGMGEIFSTYRKIVYKDGFCEKKMLSSSDILCFIDEALNVTNHTISCNKSSLYSGYNLLNDDFSCSPMKAMLEGQSAAIAGGFLSANEVCELVKEMEKDLLYKKGNYHTLYPIVKTKRFFDKNCVSPDFEAIEGIIDQDKNGNLHFNSNIVSEEVLSEKCAQKAISADLTEKIQAEFERVFEHKKFNGRSDVMYKFEGIGCAYWHQNAKFTLAILETAQKAHANGEDISEIYQHYNNILQGFIYRKTPSECGAIPIEPYSHTSFNEKSEQPGMTGQVKESIIMRRGELGVQVLDGKISFEPIFLRKDEFDENNEIKFTCYGVPCVYKTDSTKAIAINANGERKFQNSYTLDSELCRQIFERRSEINLIEIFI